MNKATLIRTLLVLIALAALAVWRAPRQISSPAGPEPREYTVAELSEDFFNILRTLQRRSMLYAAVSTSVDQKDSPLAWRTPDLAATYAWALLGIHSAHRNGHSGDADPAEIFERWVHFADTDREMYALWPLLRARAFTDDRALARDYFGWFWGRAKVQLGQVEGIMRTHRFESAEPMLLAIISRQLSEAAALLSDSRERELLHELGQLTTGEQTEELRLQFLNSGQETLSILRERIRAADKVEPYMVESVAIPQHICWGIWAEYAVYQATREEQVRERLREELRLLGLGARDAGEFHFSTLMSLLPCTEIMLALGDDQLKGQAKTALEQFIVSGWDSNLHPLCDLNGGYLAKPPGSHDLRDLCHGNSKFLSDAAWFTFQLTYFDESTRFRDRRLPDGKE